MLRKRTQTDMVSDSQPSIQRNNLKKEEAKTSKNPQKTRRVQVNIYSG